jgi:hypothetical protein
MIEVLFIFMAIFVACVIYGGRERTKNNYIPIPRQSGKAGKASGGC